MKIVVGWSGTEESRDALRLGAELAALLPAHLVVASVIQPGILPSDLPDRLEWVERFENLFEGAREELGDLEFSIRETVDDPAEGLRELALQEGANLVVLGSTHRGLIGRMFPGSVAERMLTDGTCALAIAPQDYASSKQHVGLGIVGLGYDGSPASQAALRLAARLAEADRAELQILSVVPDYVTGEYSLGPLEPVRVEARQRLGRALEQVPTTLDRSGELLTGDAAARLEEQAVALDLLVIGSRGRGPLKDRLLGSVSADVIRKAPCPVIVVPEGFEKQSAAP